MIISEVTVLVLGHQKPHVLSDLLIGKELGASVKVTRVK